MTPDQYCQDKAASSGSSFYYSFMFLPAEQRQAIVALYAFCREVDDVVDECSDPGLARIKLQWWRDEIGKIFDGEPTQPVAQALKQSVSKFNLPLEHFLEIIDGMEMDLNQVRYRSFKELQLYCYRVASVVGLMAAEIFGFEDRQTLDYALNLGLAFQLTNIVRDVREDAMLGRIYLPSDELAEFGVSEQDILSGQQTEAVTQLIRFQAQRAHEYYQKAFELLPEPDRFKQRSGIIMAAIYQATLAEIEKDNYNVLKHRIKLTPLRKLWLAWKTARSEKRRKKSFKAA
ncbi:MAG: presqualene diphosphate synthase HpnD [Gammaproteobacteria bacterium]|nr:presqualene diphosphate synthase HpnD [Gammaproteobacteria bacterium]MCF6230107.1 presqualene diphosphate synthase HpnD [Gammaproteobacteria bacterium]